jgi:large subunit ribosomal protein L6e
VDVAGVDIAKFDDSYFKSAEKKAAKQSEEGFFAEKAEKAALPAEYVANQKAVDAALLGKLRWVASLGTLCALCRLPLLPGTKMLCRAEAWCI